MPRHTPLAVILVVGVLVLGRADPAAAQPPAPGGGPSVRPPFSPYLNLLRQNSSPAVNYFGLVRPQQQFAGSLQGLQQSTAQLGAAVAGGGDQPSVTGVAFGFQTQRQYFQNQFSYGGFGTAGTGGAGAAGRPPGGAGFGQSAPARAGGRR